MANNVRTDKPQSRAIILRCSDESFMNILELLKGYADCYLVFTKSSPFKLVVSEEGW